MTSTYKALHDCQEDIDEHELDSPGILGKDLIGFETPIYYAHESQDSLQVWVVRFGDLEGRATVEWWTEDLSAKKEMDYLPGSGLIAFEAGDRYKVIEVVIKRTARWRPPLEFRVRIGKCSNCHVDGNFDFCLVTFVDDDTFPSSKYREVLSCNVEDVNPFSLYVELVALIFYEADVRWRTLVTLVLALSKHVSKLVSIWCSMYLVNNVFGSLHELELVLSTPLSTAYCIAFIYIAPMCLLHVYWRLIPWMDIQGRVLSYIHTVTMRQYLFYSREARLTVTGSKLQMSIIKDADAIAESYVAFLNLTDTILSLIIQITFILIKNPHALWCCVAMPFLAFSFAVYREFHLVKIGGNHGAWAELVDFIGGVCEHIDLIGDYSMRSKMSHIFEGSATKVRIARLERVTNKTNTAIVLKWLGPIFTAVWIVYGAPHVLDGSTSLGIFLATMSVIHSLGDECLLGFETFQNVTLSLRPLLRLTKYLNCPKDVDVSLSVAVARCNQSRKLTDQLLADGSDCIGHIYNCLPILFQDVSIGHSNHVMSSITLSLDQGKLYAVVGPHRSGKLRFLRLVAMKDFPESGSVFVPAHLRVLHVPAIPVILRLSPLDNLTFGRSARTLDDLLRVEHVIKKLKLPKVLELVQPAMQALRNRESSFGAVNFDADPLWRMELTTSDLHSIHLARAFIANPEVLVLHKPLTGFNMHRSQIVMKCMQDHIREPMCTKQADTMGASLARTIFYTEDHATFCGMADQVLSLKSLNEGEHPSSSCMSDEGLAFERELAMPGTSARHAAAFTIKAKKSTVNLVDYEEVETP